MSQLILFPGSALYKTFAKLIAEADRVFFAGLPGVGKSLLLQQMTLMANEAGRRVHLLQWDVARQAFETPKYPLENGATHPMVIKATGTWLRGALVKWDANVREQGAMLIGEVPLIGGRLMEIVRPAGDDAEALLRDARTQFAIPVPSTAIRALIESKRERSIAVPQHANEVHDAPPDLLRALWLDLLRVAEKLGLADETAGDQPYDPEIYAAVYRHLLRHRHIQVLLIDQPLQPTASVYDLAAKIQHVRATAAEAEAIRRQLEATLSLEQILTDAQNWYE